MTFFEEYRNYETRTGQAKPMPTARMTREEWRPEERKDFAAQAFYDDRQLEVYPEHVIIDKLLYSAFDSRGDLVKALCDGELHTVRVKIDKERWFNFGFPGYRYTVYVDHSRVARRTIVDTMLQPDYMSVGELWREFWWRMNRKRKAFGLLWMFNEFLGELEKAQGWR